MYREEYSINNDSSDLTNRVQISEIGISLKEDICLLTLLKTSRKILSKECN